MNLILFGSFLILLSVLSRALNREGFYTGGSGRLIDDLHKRIPWLVADRAISEAVARTMAVILFIIGVLLVAIGTASELA